MTPIQLTAALQAARPGDVIDCTGVSLGSYRIPARAYGGVTLKGGVFWDLVAVSLSGLKLIGQEFTSGGNGITIVFCSDIEIGEGNFHHLSADGIHGNSCQKVYIHDNKFTDLYSAPGNHPDAIQFFVGTSKTASSNITIRNNRIDLRQSPDAQGINFSNENAAVTSYKGLVIDTNTVLGPANKAPNMGVGVFGHSKTVLTNNFVSALAGGLRLIRTDSWSSFSKISGNSANGVAPTGAPTGWGKVIPPIGSV